MKRLIVILSLVCGAVGLQAQQFSKDYWHAGELRLTDNSYAKGEVKYDLEHDAVRLRRNGKVETFSSQQVASFQILDSKIGTMRNFFTLPYANKVGRKTPTFFEVIVEGKSTLLAREFVSIVNTGPNSLNRRRLSNRLGDPRFNDPINRNRRFVLQHKMFIVNLDGKIRELTTKRKDLFYSLKGHDDDLKKFIKKKNLKLNELTDVAKIVGHYNTISKQTRAN